MSLDRVDNLPELPNRHLDSHKGLYGRVLVLAGGRGMAGAAALCGAAALRSGAGLVRIATAAEVQPTVASFEPSFMTYPIAHDDEGLVQEDAARTALERLLPQYDVLAVGPGLGQSDGLRRLMCWIVKTVHQTLVIDADGLNNLVGQAEFLEQREHPVILTPHPGEFSRLTGLKPSEVQAGREELAARFAARHGAIVVLKGAGTVVTDGKRVYRNTTGNPGMATAGTGDVLTGVISALLGQNLPPFEAAQLGVHAHGLSGDIARDQNGEIGMNAGDLVDALPDAFQHLTH